MHLYAWEFISANQTQMAKKHISKPYRMCTESFSTCFFLAQSAVASVSLGKYCTVHTVYALFIPSYSKGTSHSPVGDFSLSLLLLRSLLFLSLSLLSIKREKGLFVGHLSLLGGFGSFFGLELRVSETWASWQRRRRQGNNGGQKTGRRPFPSQKKTT